MDFANMDFATLNTEFNALAKKTVFDTLDKLEWKIDPISPLTKDLPLVADPSGLIKFMAAYMFLVGFSLLFVKQAESKKPFFGEYFVVLAHNVFLVALSAYMSGRVLYEAFVVNNYSLVGNSYNPTEVAMAEVIWVFYVSKIYEFLDTVIMILKGNMRQVSFLHVYHHGTISVIWWMITYHAPGGDAYFSAALNSFVHVLMYTYYLLTHVLPKDPQTRKKYCWWGKYLTKFQIFQFVCNFAHAAYLITRPEPTYPMFLSKLLFWYMLTLIALFGNFYIQKHLGAAKEGKKGKKTN